MNEVKQQPKDTQPRISLRQRIRELRADLKAKGLKTFIKTAGWRVLLAIFLYYLIRDTFLYIFLPYLIARGLFSGC